MKNKTRLHSVRMLLWKEWREHRLIFFVSLAVVVLTHIISLSLLLLEPPGKDFFLRVTLQDINTPIMLSILFSLLFGTAPFTNEFSKGTHTFLLCQPITRAKIYWIKFFFGLILLILLILFTNLIFPNKPEFWFKNYLGIKFFPLNIFVIYSATFLASILFKSPLVAVIATPFIITLGLLFILIFSHYLVILFMPIVLLQEYILMLLFIILSFFFILLGFLCWHKAISKSKSPVKIWVPTMVSAVSLFLVTYTITHFVTEIQLRKVMITAKQAGLPLTLKEIIPPPVPENENSALIYEEIFPIHEKLIHEELRYIPFERALDSTKISLERNYILFGRKFDITEISLDQKKRLIELVFNDPDIRTYELLKKASNMPYCRFNVRYKDSFLTKLPHLTKMEEIANMTAIKVFLLTEQKRYDEALEFCRVGLHLSTALEDEPIYISQLFRIHWDNIAMNRLRETISDIPSDAVQTDTYRRLINEIGLRKYNYNLSLGSGLKSETAFYMDIFTRILHREIFPDEVIIGLYSGASPDFRKFFFKKIYASYLGKPLVKKDAAFFLSNMVKIVNLSSSPYYEINAKLSKLEREFESFGQGRYSVSSLLYIFLREQIGLVGYAAKLDGLKIALALKIYKAENGKYPDFLELLIPGYLRELPKDPITGKNYIYRKEGEGFIVYSVGWNFKDDGGMNDIKHGQRRDDLAWRCLR